jgi:hypothetical protein
MSDKKEQGMQHDLAAKWSGRWSYWLIQQINPASDIAAGEQSRFSLNPVTNWQAALTFLTLCAISSLPVLLTKMPAMVDYPNHLARFYIIGHDTNPVLSKFYSVIWRPIPDLAGDTAVPIFAKIFNIYTAGKLFVFLIIVLITSGTYALHYALYRRSTGSAVCFLFIYNGIFMYGFLNYLFSIGLALWATAGWVAFRDRPWLLRTIYSTFAVSVLYLSHLVSVGLYALAILCYEVVRLGETNRDQRTFVFDTAAALVPFLVVVPMALSILPTLATHDLSGTDWPRLSTKWRGLYYIVRNGYFAFDAIFCCFLVLFFGFLLYSKRIEIPCLGWLFLMFAGLVYLATPEWVFHVWAIDVRLPVAFVFFLIAMVRWCLDTPRAAVIFNSIIVVAVALRALGVADTWQVYGKIASDYEKSFGQIEPGSRILVTRDDAGAWRRSNDGVKLGMDGVILWHLPVLAAVDRLSLVSTIFAHSGNPLTIKAPFRDAIPIDRTSTLGVRDLDTSPGRALPPHGYVRDWRDRYDYLYVQFAFPGSHPNLAGVRLVYQGSSFQLYKVAVRN